MAEGQGTVTASDLRAALPQLTERERDMDRYEAEVIRRLDGAASALEARDERIAELTAKLEEAKAKAPPEGWMPTQYTDEMGNRLQFLGWDPERNEVWEDEGTYEQYKPTLEAAIAAARAAAGEVRDGTE